MAYDLVKKILSQAEKLGAKPENLSDLNSLLQSEAKGYFAFFWGLTGGLGAIQYNEIQPYLLIEEGIFKGIKDADKIKERAEAWGTDKTQENAYKAAICHALIAVYEEDLQKKKSCL